MKTSKSMVVLASCVFVGWLTPLSPSFAVGGERDEYKNYCAKQAGMSWIGAELSFLSVDCLYETPDGTQQSRKAPVHGYEEGRYISPAGSSWRLKETGVSKTMICKKIDPNLGLVLENAETKTIKYYSGVKCDADRKSCRWSVATIGKEFKCSEKAKPLDDSSCTELCQPNRCLDGATGLPNHDCSVEETAAEEYRLSLCAAQCPARPFGAE